MGPASAQLIDELGYDPDDGVPELVELAGGELARASRVSARRVPRHLAQRVAPGTIIAARLGGQPVAVARLGSGRLVVVADECPHDGGRISDGFVDGDRLVCARHGWELEARNGRCERACKLRE
ncbi:MAG TPA: Rieske 2Fe-2S domain-containing protein [Kofleriaceae bacterium]|nr:Rieske 2Fe-2S domain-containing protein [Kofleriaceae bacterium]HMG52544.1 Rieske 2Fe-2S domain-containing protein [Kofleriaceae bacterium]